jgi:hypothetical protein
MNRISTCTGLALLLMCAAACRSQPDLDNIAIGQDVALTRADGGVVEGTVASFDDTSVHLTTGQTTKAIPRNQIVDVTVVDEGGQPVRLPPAAKFREYTVPEGTTLPLSLATAINSGTARPEDRVDATLAEAVSVAGTEVLPAGSRLQGTVSAVEGSGKVKGVAHISLHFTSLAPAERGDHYDIDATYSETARSTKRSDATKIGIGAGAGAAVGALLGGKSGAAKGAAIGGGAGTAVVLSTTGDEVERPVGARLTVRLMKSLEVRVPID